MEQLSTDEVALDVKPGDVKATMCREAVPGTPRCGGEMPFLPSLGRSASPPPERVLIVEEKAEEKVEGNA